MKRRIIRPNNPCPRACVGLFVADGRRRAFCYSCPKLKSHLAIFNGYTVPEYDSPRNCEKNPFKINNTTKNNKAL